LPRATEPPSSNTPIVYHGSTTPIREFNPEKTGLKRGIFFSDTPTLANEFATGVWSTKEPLLHLGDDDPAQIKALLTDTFTAAESKRLSALVDKFVEMEKQRESQGPFALLPDGYTASKNEVNDALEKATHLQQGAHMVRVQIDLGKTYHVDLGGERFDGDKEAAAVKYARDNGYDSITFTGVAGAGRFYTVFKKEQIKSPYDGSPVTELYQRQRPTEPSAIHEIPGFHFGPDFLSPNELYQIKAFHGSPHDFDRFDLSKIGMGEGAQAYGHGLYFAENEGVAGSYRDALKKSQVEINTKNSAIDATNHPDYNVRLAGRLLDANGGDIDAAIRHLSERESSEAPLTKLLKSWKDQDAKVQINNPGKLYQVSIKAEPEHFLDWDKPLSEQSEHVQKALEPLLRGEPESERRIPVHTALQYKFMREEGAAGSAQKASEALHSAGIPGIKYLDQGSRTAGEGSRNYVVFDDKLIDITHKDGTPVTAEERAEITDSLFQRSQKQSAKGSYKPVTPEEIVQGLRPLLRIRPDADASTVAHEFSHEYLQQFERDANHPDAPQILKEDWNETLKWLGAKDASALYERTARGDLTAKATRLHEKFARGEEVFRWEGRAPSAALARVFQQFAQWMRSIYNTLRDIEKAGGFKPGELALTEQMREVYGRRLTDELDWQEPPQRTVIAPEREVAKNFADIHEADAEATLPEHAEPAALNVDTERDSLAAEKLIEEEQHARLENVTEKDRRLAPGSEKPPGDGNETGTAGREGGTPPAPGEVRPGVGEALAEGAGTSANAAERGAGRKAAGAVASEPPASENARFSGPKSPFIDKAGNIRLDKLDTSDDVLQVIRETAANNNDFWEERRGILSDHETLALSDALGMDPAWLDRKKIGDAFNIEEVRAVRRLAVQSATAVRDAFIAAKSGTIEDAIKLAEAMSRHEMIQAKVSGATAEAGRTLYAFRENIPGSENVALVDTWMKQNTGRSLFQIQEMARYGSNLTKPSQISRFVFDTANGNIKNAIVFYYVNALISGPITHLRYAAGNALTALYAPIVKVPIAAGIGKARSLFDSDTERVYIGEAGAQLYGFIKGSREGFRAAIEGWKTGNTPHLPGEGEINMFEAQPMAQPIPGRLGYVIGIPGKSVGAIHGFFSALRYEQEIHGLAYRTASQEGLTGDAFTSRVADLTNRPLQDMMEAASTTARRDLYMAPSDYQSFEAKLARISNHNIASKIILPFVKIGTQITARAFEGTPLAPFQKRVRENLSGEHGAPARDMQLATIAGGSALMATMVGMVLEGNATGDGPSNPEQRAVWLLAHHPNSIQIGNVSVSYARLGAIGMQLRTAANATEAYQGWGEDEGHMIVGDFLYGFEKAILEEGFLTGVKDLIDAVYHHEEYGQRYLAQMVTNWMPWSVGFGQVSKQIDPYQRETRGHDFMDAMWKDVEAKVPWLSKHLMPRRDMFGEPIPQTGAVQNYANDRVVQVMDNLHVKVGRLERKLRGVELTDQQYDDYTRVAGRTAKMFLNSVVQPGFERLPKGVQLELIQKAIAAGHKIGADSVIASGMGSSNDIMQKAVQGKQEKLIGKPATAH